MMTTIERDIEVSAPIAEADREWTGFTFGKAVGGRRRPQADLAAFKESVESVR